MHIVLLQECEWIMATKLIIDGNAVYEIDEDCLESQKKKNEFQRRTRSQESAGEPGQEKKGRRENLK